MSDETRPPTIDLSPIIEAFQPLRDALIAAAEPAARALAREMATLMENARREREQRGGHFCAADCDCKPPAERGDG